VEITQQSDAQVLWTTDATRAVGGSLPTLGEPGQRGSGHEANHRRSHGDSLLED
jgi:hypothetical protein